jgi:hypothetical protein
MTCPIFKRTFPLLVLMCWVTSTAFAATNSFVGDWKFDLSKSKYIDRMKVDRLGASKYTFDFGGSPETIVVDGSDQHGYSGTMLSVTAEGHDSWKVVRKMDGHMMLSAAWKLSPDGNTLTDSYTDFTQGSPSTEILLYKRTAAGQGFAGTWERSVDLRKFASVIQFQIRPFEETGLSLIQSVQDITRNVKFDGKDYPSAGHGVVPGSTSSARRVDARTLEITDKVRGKITRTEQLALSADLKTLTRTVHPVGQHNPNVFVFERQ